MKITFQVFLKVIIFIPSYPDIKPIFVLAFFLIQMKSMEIEVDILNFMKLIYLDYSEIQEHISKILDNDN